MATLDAKINQRKILIKVDIEKMEKLLSLLGFFSEDFLKSLERAEKNIKEGKIKKIKSLKELK
jgi:hypothetical protein